MRDRSKQWLSQYGLLAGMAILWTGLLIGFAVARYDRLNATVFDLGIKSQVIWNTAQGNWFASTVEVEHYLGDHVQFIFLLIAPLFYIWEDVRILLILQAVLLGLGAVPVYRLAQRRLLNRPLALAFAAAYLLYPTIGFVNRFDFHPVTFTIFFILMAVDLLESEHPWGASCFVLLALLSREEVGFTVFALGLYVILIMKQRKIGLIWALTGLVYSLTAVFVIIPTFRGEVSDSLGRYAWLGDGPAAMIKTLLTRPFTVLQTLLGDPIRQQFLLKLLLPVGFLSLLAPAALLVGLPALAYNLLSDVPSQNSIYFQYISPLIPFIFLAAIQGAARVQHWLTGRMSRPQTTAALTAWLALFVFIAWLLDNPFTQEITDPYFPVYGLEQFYDRRPFDEARAQLPDEAAVATMMGFGAHLSLRPEMMLFYDRLQLEERPYGFPQTDYLLLHLSDLRWGVNARLFHSAIETAVGQYGYEALYFQDDVVLLKQLPEPRPETGRMLQQLINLQEAGGKYAPTAPSTLDWLGAQWRLTALPDTAVPLNTQFENGISLLGYQLSESTFQPGMALCIILYWSADTAVNTDLTVFLHLAAADGFVISQRDNPPSFGFNPTTAWQPAEIVADLHCLQIPPQQDPGTYHFNTGLYDPQTGSRLPIRQTSHPLQDEAIHLLKIELPTSE